LARGLGHWYVEVQKQAWWRGVQHLWVNRYVLSGSDPTASQGESVAYYLLQMENKLYPNVEAGIGVGFVKASAYKSTGGAPLATYYSNESQSPSSATGFTGPSSTYATLSWQNTLEVCLDVRTELTALSSSGKPVYLRKFYRGFLHGGEDNGSTPIASGDLTAIDATLAELQTGIGSTSYVVIGPSGGLASGAPTAQPHLGNHQIPRGRKRSRASETSSAYASGVVAGAALGGAAAANS
jgi:hypothetical protein